MPSPQQNPQFAATTDGYTIRISIGLSSMAGDNLVGPQAVVLNFFIRPYRTSSSPFDPKQGPTS
ncbi:hypothetical protein FS749_010099 [Ceratobasidium sp. UAMH 11750]|nr:hypothetical protein FS749_010099 [Ceratobasidium sp. UAMH 11750]